MSKTVSLFLVVMIFLAWGGCLVCIHIGQHTVSEFREVFGKREVYFETCNAVESTRTALLECLSNPTDEELLYGKNHLTELTVLVDRFSSFDYPSSMELFMRMLDRYVEQCSVMLDELMEGKSAAASAQYQELLENTRMMTEYRMYLEPEITDYIFQTAEDTRLLSIRRQRMLLVVMAVVFPLLLIVAVVLLKRFLSPIRALTDHLKRTSFDRLEEPQIECRRKDEAGVIVQAVTQMIRLLREQLAQRESQQEMEQNLKQEKILRLETENQLAESRVHSFQSQINAHFLFNSLNMVARFAYLEGAPNARHAAELIAHFLRVQLERFDQKITVEQEFECVDLYVQIQQLRFESRIHFEGSLPDDCRRIPVISMILQPLVENALAHGVGAYGEGGLVRYYARLEGERLILGTEDNGTGMGGEKIALLMSRLTDGGRGSAEDGIGLTNVYRRLSLEYPGRVTPLIESTPGVLTRVEFHIDRP